MDSEVWKAVPGSAGVEIIVEVSTNHGGDEQIAAEFIRRFADAGATTIKLQSHRVKHLRRDDPQYAWMQQSELSWDAHARLFAVAKECGVQLATTVYHPDEVWPVKQLGIQTLKIGSGEAGDLALAQVVQATGFQRLLIGCGLKQPVNTPYYTSYLPHAFLHCVTRYPCPITAAGDVVYDGDPYTGWSDHCVGLEGCYSAVHGGATILEVHGCLPRIQAREVKPYEKTPEDVAQLRAWVDADPQRFLGRWNYDTPKDREHHNRVWFTPVLPAKEEQ